MIRKEAILRSPLRILDLSIRGGLGRGHLGVVSAAAGMGKSACLVQLGIDALLRERPVLHLALRQSVEHVAARYDALFDELADRVELADRRGVREALAQRRLLWSSLDEPWGARALREALDVFLRHHGRAPHAVLVDGFAWGEPGAAAALGAVKAGAASAGAELWMTAGAGEGAGLEAALGALPAEAAALVDVAILLEPHGPKARLSLVKDFDRRPADVHLVLEGGALRRDDEAPPAANEPRTPGDFTLLASASAGAEAEFGACAERWGLGEVNFTFAGRREEGRTRGLRLLSEDELRVGDVSAAYVKAHLHRALDAPELHRVLEAIWHQVNGAGEVFAVGALQADRTVQGGTGWAVELARHWGKPVHLYDQGRGAWLCWDGRDWVAEEPPAITHQRFAGAGTRALGEQGRAAIRALYERSFGAAPE